MTPDAAAALARATDHEELQAPRARPPCLSTPAPCWSSAAAARSSSSTATACARAPPTSACRTCSRWRASSRCSSGRCSARVRPLPLARVSGDPHDIAESTASSNTSRTDHRSTTGSTPAREHVQFTGLPARIGWLGHGERSLLATQVNARGGGGPPQGPDRLHPRPPRRRLGRRPVPRNREDAGWVGSHLATGRSSTRCWPARTAPTWSRCTPWGAIPASPPARPRWRTARRRPPSGCGAVLDGDTGIGIMRHAEAGYERALENKRAHGLGFA